MQARSTRCPTATRRAARRCLIWRPWTAGSPPAWPRCCSRRRGSARWARRPPTSAARARTWSSRCLCVVYAALTASSSTARPHAPPWSAKLRSLLMPLHTQSPDGSHVPVQITLLVSWSRERFGLMAKISVFAFRGAEPDRPGGQRAAEGVGRQRGAPQGDPGHQQEPVRPWWGLSSITTGHM